MTKLLFLAVFLSTVITFGADRLELIKDGKSKYKIIFDNSTAIPSEKTAYNELKEYLNKISGLNFLTTPSSKSKNIIVGINKYSMKFFGEKVLNSLTEEQILIRSDKDENIYIAGGRPRGTLFAVYYFLDNILGVHWYHPGFEYVPRKHTISFEALNINMKPAFQLRKIGSTYVPWKETHGVVSPLWAARNKLNNNGSVAGSKYSKILPKYGYGVYFAPPYPCHALFQLIPPGKYFKLHPEWWALQDGRRQVYGHKRGVSASYCLSNPELVKETAKQALIQLHKFPQSKFISVAEGDNTYKRCECKECEILFKKFGNTESGLWINFVNQVADLLKNEFPDVKVVPLAYTRTAKPPQNIKARDNVTPHICIWGKFRGLSYNDPKNLESKKFIDEIFLPWTKICKNVLIWDYISTYNDLYLPQPDLLVNIDNIKFFKENGVIFYCPEGDYRDYGGNGQPFKNWLIARCMWNPDNIDGNKLLKQFCKEYYGEKAADHVYKYYTMMQKANMESGYYKIGQGGWLGKAPHVSLEIMLQADKLFQAALAQAEGNETYAKHLRITYVSVLYMFAKYYNQYKAEAEKGNLKLDSFQYYYQKAIKIAEQYDLLGNSKAKPLSAMIREMQSLGDINFKASSSGCFGGTTPYNAFDNNINTLIAFGNFRGWLQTEFPTVKELNRISIAWPGKNTTMYDYEIKGSLDGKKYWSIVPRTKLQRSVDDYEYNKKLMFSDHKLNKPVKAKFVRTIIHKAYCEGEKRKWTGISEQVFNASDSEWGKLTGTTNVIRTDWKPVNGYIYKKRGTAKIGFKSPVLTIEIPKTTYLDLRSSIPIKGIKPQSKYLLSIDVKAEITKNTGKGYLQVLAHSFKKQHTWSGIYGCGNTNGWIKMNLLIDTERYPRLVKPYLWIRTNNITGKFEFKNLVIQKISDNHIFKNFILDPQGNKLGSHIKLKPEKCNKTIR